MSRWSNFVNILLFYYLHAPILAYKKAYPLQQIADFKRVGFIYLIN